MTTFQYKLKLLEGVSPAVGECQGGEGQKERGLCTGNTGRGWKEAAKEGGKQRASERARDRLTDGETEKKRETDQRRVQSHEAGSVPFQYEVGYDSVWIGGNRERIHAPRNRPTNQRHSILNVAFSLSLHLICFFFPFVLECCLPLLFSTRCNLYFYQFSKTPNFLSPSFQICILPFKLSVLYFGTYVHT